MKLATNESWWNAQRFSQDISSILQHIYQAKSMAANMTAKIQYCLITRWELGWQCMHTYDQTHPSLSVLGYRLHCWVILLGGVVRGPACRKHACCHFCSWCAAFQLRGVRRWCDRWGWLVDTSHPGKYESEAREGWDMESGYTFLSVKTSCSHLQWHWASINLR